MSNWDSSSSVIMWAEYITKQMSGMPYGRTATVEKFTFLFIAMIILFNTRIFIK